jgi:hypothetical protein
MAKIVDIRIKKIGNKIYRTIIWDDGKKEDKLITNDSIDNIVAALREVKGLDVVVGKGTNVGKIFADRGRFTIITGGKERGSVPLAMLTGFLFVTFFWILLNLFADIQECRFKSWGDPQHCGNLNAIQE